MSHPNQISVSTSSEFMALCQFQLALLTQGLGAARSAVYLTEGLLESPSAKLIPVLVYPQTAVEWQEGNLFTRLSEVWERVDSTPRLLSAATPDPIQEIDNQAQTDSSTTVGEEKSLVGKRQIVLPLIHEDIVMGLLVTGRKDREWNQGELAQIEKIARTLAIARLLDQRQEWYQQELLEQENARRIQRDRLDNLLHQLRNPLTALRTFSKLLMKRLLPEDRNQKVAQGILREGDRLRELLENLEEEIELMARDPSPVMLGYSTFIFASSFPRIDFFYSSPW